MTSENGYSDICFVDLIEYTRDGEWGYEKEREDTTLSYVIRGTDFSDISLSNLESLPQRYIDHRKFGNKQLRPNDIIIETAGGTKGRLTGRTVFLKDALFTKASLPFVCASFSRFLRVKKEFCDPRYLQYYLSNMYNEGQMSMFNVQHTGVSRFQYTDFAHRTTIHLPSLPEQRAVSAILSALDDKIELTHRMNKTFEAVGQAIFKRWFVDFEFPNEEGKPYKSSGGEMAFSEEIGKELPATWSVGKYSDLVDVFAGKGLKRDELTEDGKCAVLGANGELGRTNEFLFDERLILTGRVGTLGKVYLSSGKAWVSDNVLISRPKFEENCYYAYFTLKSFDMESLNRGSTQPLVTQTDLKSQSVVLPERKILVNFQKITNSLYDKVDMNKFQIACLSQLRDALLPKLMSGKIRVFVPQEAVET